MSLYFSNNLKLLRKRRKRTQDDVAFTLKMKRSTYSGYENEIAQPGMEALVQLSNYYGLSIDTLLKVDLTALSESQLRQIEMGSDIYMKGSNLRVLATTVDGGNNENIELVNEKAKAGYALGYADPEYIRVLPVFSLPFLSQSKKYRSFQISGDSMLPIPHASYITGEFVQNWFSLRDGDACIVITRDDGIVFKCIENKLKSMGKLGLYSLNPLYQPFNIDASDITEIWKFVNYISSEMPEAVPADQEVYKTVANLRDDIQQIKQKLSID
ncbi:MAG: helix-turn-helix transcriptional regulator [Bacteroidales bacterium]|nr:helix-turn-helix transcriptional regulator [Bacteroidales bacterium]